MALLMLKIADPWSKAISSKKRSHDDSIRLTPPSHNRQMRDFMTSIMETFKEHTKVVKEKKKKRNEYREQKQIIQVQMLQILQHMLQQQQQQLEKINKVVDAIN